MITPNSEKIFDPRIIEEDSNARIWTSDSVALAIDGLEKNYELQENPFNKRIKSHRLRRNNVAFRYSDDELIVWKKCMQDKVFYGNNFGKLKDGAKGWSNIVLRDYQENLLHRYSEHRWNIIMFPRQSGKTTTTIIEIAHFLTFNYDKDCVIIAQSQKVIDEIIAKLKEFFSQLPFFLQPGFIKFTDDTIILENGCRLKIGIAAESVVQGFSLDLLYIDEVAYISNTLWDKFWINVFPALANNPESRCIMTSTPNGRNHFYALWQAAVLKQNLFVPYRIRWQDVPGRDEKFKADTIKMISEIGWEMGFECSFDTQLKSVFNNRIQKHLRSIQEQSIQTKCWIDFTGQGKEFYLNDNLIDFEDYHIFTIDIAEGLEQDYSVIKGFKISWNIEKQRLEYTAKYVLWDNTIGVEELACKLLTLIAPLNPSRTRVVLELNKYGGEFLQAIKTLRLTDKERFNKIDMVMFAKFVRNKSTKEYELGVLWNANNKAIAVKSFVKLVSDGIIIDSHPESIEESMNFGRMTNGTYKASYGHDDLVMVDVSLSYMINNLNIYNKDWLGSVEYQLRIKSDDKPQSYIDKLAAEEAERNQFEHNGFTVRNHRKEYNSRARRTSGSLII